jgi:DNA polymerase III subunit epsilon
VPLCGAAALRGGNARGRTAHLLPTMTGRAGEKVVECPSMWDMNGGLTDVEFVAFDLETTGLSPSACQIVEMGGVRFRANGCPIDEFEQLIDPRCAIPRVATRIHGITDTMVRGMPTLADALPRFLEFLGRDRTILMAHNASFDLGFLHAAMLQTGCGTLRNPVIDTLQLARRCIRGSRTYRLADLAIHLRLASAEDHRALSDARLVQSLFCRILALPPEMPSVARLFTVAPPLNVRVAVCPEPAGPINHAHLALAIAQQRTVVMVYEGGTQGLADRRVTPRQLDFSRGFPCLIAYCHTDCMEKTFRLDRIRNLRLEGDDQCP